MFRASGLSLGLKSCCQVFGHSALAGLLALERRLHTPSFFGALQNFYRCDFYARAGRARAGKLAFERVVFCL